MNIFRSKILTKMLSFLTSRYTFCALVLCYHHAMTALFEYSGSPKIDSFSHIPILNLATVRVRYSIISVGDVTEVDVYSQ